VLEVFGRPATFKGALETLQPYVKGTQDWVDLSDTIRNLYEAGALEPLGRPSRRPAMGTGFDAPAMHVRMLNDRARTEAYLHAIREVVQPGDVVVELGTGTGVLAVAAAKAGARHVYAIEAGAIGQAAESVFRANGLSDRITLVPGLSTHVSLPERADVLVSEVIGNEPLHERVLQSTRDAIQRFLKPDARFVPRTLDIFAVPVEVPESFTSTYRFMESNQTAWKEWYGVDFTPLNDGNPADPFRVFLQPHRPKDWVRLSEPALLAEIDFASGHPPRIESRTCVPATREGLVNGIVVYFELGLSPRQSLSVNPACVDDRCSWRIPVWLLPDSLPVEAGESLKFTYAYGSKGQQSRLSVTPARLGEMPRPE
jgi:hypothetical protein